VCITEGDPRQNGTAVHEHLLSLVKKYLVVGGMPAAVRHYAEQGDIARCIDMQTSITQTFRDDFGKYAKKARHGHIETVFMSAARTVGRRFKYSHVDPEAKSRDLKDALQLLERAGVLYRVRATSGAGLPFEAEADERAFKTVFLDVGLMQNLCGIAQETALADDLLAVYAGALAEQLVGQELVAYQNPLKAPGLFFWVREAPHSIAEVDYLHAHGSTVLPIEVKAGTTGTLRSAHLFLSQYKRSIVMKVSQSAFSYDPPALCVPLYAIEAIPRLLRMAEAGELTKPR
jgi:predicted AAA+ superfamily ATPase